MKRYIVSSLALAALGLSAGCSGTDGVGVGSTFPEDSMLPDTAPVSPTTDAPAPSSSTVETTVETTVGTTTTVTTTTVATTEPADEATGPTGLIRLWPQPELVGVASGSAIDDLTQRLGAPTEDTDWRAMPPTLACTGNLDYRSVHWGDLRIVIERRTDGAESVLTGWSLGRASIPLAPTRSDDSDLEPPTAATTIEGVGIGDPVSDIGAATVSQLDETTWQIPAGGGVLIETDGQQRIVGIATGRGDCIGLDITHLPCNRPVPVFELPDGSPAGDVSFDEGAAFWGIENGNAGDDFSNFVSEILGGVPADDPRPRNAATGSTQAVSGDTTVSAVPNGDPGARGWRFYVFDAGTECVRVLSTSATLTLPGARNYAQTLVDALNPQL